MSAYNDDDHKDAPFPSMGIMQPDETPVWPLSRLLFAGGIVTVILMTWLAALYYQYNSHLSVKKDIPAKDMMGATKTIGLVRTEAQQALNAQPHVADPGTGRIAIPIALAEQKVLAELKANPEADVTGPAPPAPAPAEAEAAPDGNSEEASPPAEEMKAEDKKPEEPSTTPEDEGDKKPADEETTEEKDDAEKQPAEKPESSSEEPKEETASPKEEGDESTAEEDTSTEPEANSDE